MMKHSFTLLFIFILQYSIGQRNNAVQLAIAQSPNNYRFHEIFDVPVDPEEIIIFRNTVHYGISYRSENQSGNFFEISLLGTNERKFSLRKWTFDPEMQRDPSFEINRKDAHLRLEFGKHWKIPGHDPLRIGVSASLDPRFTKNQYLAQVSNRYNSYFSSFETSSFVIPQFCYNINDRVTVTFKVPVEVVNHHIIQGTQDNPSIPLDERNVSQRNLHLLPLNHSYTFTIGYFITHINRKSASELTSFWNEF